MNFRKNGISNLFTGIIFTFLTMFLTGCVSDKNDLPTPENPESDKISVSMVISGEGLTTTRATEEAQGSVDENYIDISDLYILTFDIPASASDQTDFSKYRLKEIVWSPDEALRNKDAFLVADRTRVILRTFLDEASYNTSDSYCMVTVANIKNWLPSVDGKNAYTDLTPGTTSISDLQRNLNYARVIKNYSWSPKNTPGNGMPLFGIQKFTLSGYNAEIHGVVNPYRLPDVLLLRTMAKVEISISENVKVPVENGDEIPLEIENVTSGTNYNTNSWLIPEPERMDNFTTSLSTGQISTAPDYQAYPTVKANAPLNFTENSSGSFVAYIPEYDLSTNSREIDVTFDMGKYGINKFTLYLQPYLDGEPRQVTAADPAYWHSVLRNHVYSIEIIAIEMDINPVINLTVCKWNEYTSDIPQFN